jgi:hypothetical protein
MTPAYHVRDRGALTSGSRAEPDVLISRWPVPDLCRGYWSPSASSSHRRSAPERVGLARRDDRVSARDSPLNGVSPWWFGDRLKQAAT